MARAIHKLTDRSCKTLNKPGMMSDGGGLYLSIKPSGSRSWSFVWKKDGKRNEMGLGAYPAVSLAKARILAADNREIIAEGRNPIEERRKDTVPTFGECADQFIASMETQWRNEKHRAQWRMTLATYAEPIRSKRVSDVNTDDVLKVLNPIWQKRPETASRLRGRIERVLDYAKARGWRSGENPALWRGHLKSILPARTKLSRGHHAAMPYKDVPAFVERLRGLEAISARALEFLILTAARSGEVREATWEEFDLEAGIWTVPASRMKAGKEHRVPLSGRALEIVDELQKLQVSDFVFPGQRADRPMSNMAYAMLMRRLKLGQYTVHGFRSAFRDWAGDETHFPRDIAEQALAHQIGNETERAYRRADALGKRRELMAAWADHCLSEITSVGGG
jgi:integrase